MARQDKMLQDLPPELITEIFLSLEKPDLAGVRLASKQLEAFATPLLFRDLSIHINDKDLVHIPIQRVLKLSFGSQRNLLHLVRRIEFKTYFRANYTRRCPHHPQVRGVEEESDDDDAWDNKGEDTEGEEESRGKSRKTCEEDEFVDDDSDSVETRYPDDDLLEPYEMTDTEKRDVDMYIPWEYDIENPVRFTQIKNRVMAMLIRCREGSLTEFNWDLGICCPGPVLSDDGILPRRQKNLETIRIINDSRCHGHDYWLADFAKLKRLTWIPLTWRSDFDALALGLEKFAHQLTLLELDIFENERKCGGYRPEYFKSEEERDRPNYFAWDIMGLCVNQKKCVFHFLERLYLCGIPFDMAEMEMANAFNWSRLQSLHLRFCSGWGDFLQQVIGSGQRIHLKSLTMEPAPVLESPGEEVDAICSFLHGFTGLRNLFLSTNEEYGTLEIWRAVLNHKDTLKIFVHNQRVPADFWAEEDDLDGLPPLDPPQLPFTTQELEMMEDDPATNPLSQLDIEFLGLTFPPFELKCLLLPFTNKNTLKLLHIRQAGGYTDQYDSWGIDPSDDVHPRASQDLVDFGNWVFGPNGIPSLKGLAFGDFSYGNRHCRDRYLTMIELTNPPLDVRFADELAACPQNELNSLHSYPWRFEYE
ncbi:uncharacterized protein BJX67DRAFT_354930 [Aspergillus lucknowensis]|uniref:F-box domain-containing protein n=1 Tax=Aspergillus lucknowensis TaxID=176173 RepID=A0ABR4LSY5_9EURO